jgi:hypothetical protein
MADRRHGELDDVSLADVIVRTVAAAGSTSLKRQGGHVSNVGAPGHYRRRQPRHSTK